MVLVLTLSILVLITAMVTEFVYGVYTGTNALYNWYNSQRLSMITDSGMGIIAKEFISDTIGKKDYTYPNIFEMSFESQSKDFPHTLQIKIEDENSRFNINKIVNPVGTINEEAYNSLKRLLSYLSIDKDVASYIADWIDPDREERVMGSEKGAKNASLYSTDELLLIKGIDKATSERLLPYITVYGDGLININSADMPVLMCISDAITEELAKRVIDYRRITPFENITELQKVAGFDLPVHGPISHRITVKGRYFYVKVSGISGGINRRIEAVIGINRDIKYWREF